jgi:hypothetical protein
VAFALAAPWLLALVYSGCSSGPGTRIGSDTPWMYEHSTADAASYGADSFSFAKPGQPRRPASGFQFYYKSCAADDGKTFYSKTSYVCAEPW